MRGGAVMGEMVRWLAADGARERARTTPNSMRPVAGSQNFGTGSSKFACSWMLACAAWMASLGIMSSGLWWAVWWWIVRNGAHRQLYAGCWSYRLASFVVLDESIGQARASSTIDKVKR